MIAVSDTSPLCYLTLIGELDILPRLFGQVLVPQAVIDELLHRDAPVEVRAWAARQTPWISIRQNPAGIMAGMEKLQIGEQSAILLAESCKADVILLDEKSARSVAAARGIRVTGRWVYWRTRPHEDLWIYRARLTSLLRRTSDTLRHCSGRLSTAFVHPRNSQAVLHGACVL